MGALTWRTVLAGAAAALCLSAGSPALAQGVYKCMKDGKVSYQAEPCTGGRADAVKIAPGPSETELAAARKRADAEKAQAASIRMAQPSGRQGGGVGGALPGFRGGSCEQLAAQRESAYGRRNGALAAARQGAGVTAGSAGDADIASRQFDIRDIESRMASRGCKTPG